MYESYNYQSEQNNQNMSTEEQQAKLREKLIAEKKARKKATTRKVAAIIGGALLFGIIAGGTTIGVNVLGKNVLAELIPGIESVKEEKQSKNDSDSESKEAEEVKKKENNVEINKVEPINNKAKSERALDGTMPVADVAESVMPSIVSITNKSLQEVRSMFSNRTQVYESESRGSGIIIGKNDDELLILTNNHVVEGAKEITVGFIDDEIYGAVTKGGDSDNDLAVIAVKFDDLKDSTADAIKIAAIGDSDELVIGEQVVAIGNALGYGQSVTTGIVSALDRDGGFTDYVDSLIQTDAAINPGNSGGALLNMKGEVVGINSAKVSSSKIEGMGYAIPISTAMPIVEGLMTRETRELVDAAEAGYLGISGVTITSDQSDALGIPKGAGISEVTEGAAADKAGLKKGDIIVKFDGITISGFPELKEQIAYYKAGETVDVVIARADDGEYKEKTISLTLDEWPEDLKKQRVEQQEAEEKAEESAEEGQSEDESSGNSIGGNFNPNDIGNMGDIFKFFGY